MIYFIVSVYIIGGLTFVPLLLFVVGALVFYTSPVVPIEPAGEPTIKRQLSVQSNKEGGESKEPEPPKIYRSGWLTVRRTYESIQVGDGTYMGMLTQGYRTFMDNRSKDPKRSRSKDRFFAVLKQSVLFLYEDEDQVDCAAAIEVTLHDVVLFPLAKLDGELYVKRRAIRLQPRGVPLEPHDDNLPEKVFTEKMEAMPERFEGKSTPWYLFPTNNYEKEDWFFTLVGSSKLGGPEGIAAGAKDASLFNSDDMAKLVEGIDDQPDPIPMRWLNAFIGRLFLSVYRTDQLESYIIGRIMKKLTRVKIPPFLSAIKVREVNVGTTTPFFSKPMLKELTIDGNASMEVHAHYRGEFRITVETVATINLGSRFKPYAVDLVLAVIIKEIEGNLLVKLKKPPTNRLWFGFTSMPRMVMNVEPVVSTRQIKWGMILKTIESRIREVVLESIVVPNLDDLSFFNSQPYTHRGGIWGDAARQEVLVSPNEEALAVATAAQETGDENAKTDTDESPMDDKEPASLSKEESSTSGSLRHRSSTISTDEKPPLPLLDKLSGGPSVASLQSTQSAPVVPGDKKRSWFASAKRKETQTSPAQTPSRAGSVEPVEGESDVAARLREVLRSRTDPSKVVSTSGIDELIRDQKIRDQKASSRSTTLSPLDVVETDMESVQSSSAPSASSVQLAASSSSLVPATERTASSQSSSPDTKVRDSSPALSVRRLPPQTAPREPGQDPTVTPPKRHATSQSLDNTASMSNTSTIALLNQWRTKASDKEAIAAGVSQARDAVKKWGATWNSKRKSRPAYTNGFNPIDVDALSGADLDLDLPPGAVRVDSARRESSEEHQSQSYREYRAGLGKQASEEQSLQHPTPDSTDNDTPTTSVHDDASTSPSLRGKPRLASRHGDSQHPNDDLLPKRQRTPSSTHGHFLPAAAQTTRSLSVSSASLAPTPPPGSPKHVASATASASPPVPSRPVSMLPVVSERTSYRPPPAMMIPSTKDPLHNMSMGSDSFANSSVTGLGVVSEKSLNSGSSHGTKQRRSIEPEVKSLRETRSLSSMNSGSRTPSVVPIDVRVVPPSEDVNDAPALPPRHSAVSPPPPPLPKRRASPSPEPLLQVTDAEATPRVEEVGAKTANLGDVSTNVTESDDGDVDEAWGLEL